MPILYTYKWLGTVLAAVFLLVLLAAWQLLYVTHHYTASVPAPHIPRGTETFGSSGTPLQFVVMGDSTSIAQGAVYDRGVARMSARLLAQTHRVFLTNTGVSGAQVCDVRAHQLAQTAALKPDVVLLAIGANDVTHVTSLASVHRDTAAIIDQLRAANPDVRIILTGSPAMGSVARFASPTQWLAGARVRQINAVFAAVAAQKDVILLPLAAKTGYAFKHNPKLFAPDNFHPNADGYVLWQAVINDGLVRAGLAAR